MSTDLYGVVIAGLMALVERELASESAEAAETIGAQLHAGNLELRVAVAIGGQSARISAGVADIATGEVTHLLTTTVPTVWPGEYTGAAAGRH